jgi:hypothetical protein
MFTRILLALALSLVCPAVRAAGPEPTEASVKQLLGVMHLDKSLDSITAQIYRVMQNAAQQAAGGESLPATAQQSVERCRADVKASIKDDLTWNKMEPTYVQIYQEAFTQAEVNAMIAFYKTPIGQSIVTKLPVAMQKAQNQTMQAMSPTMQRIRQMQQEVAAAVKSSH